MIVSTYWKKNSKTGRKRGKGWEYKEGEGQEEGEKNQGWEQGH